MDTPPPSPGAPPALRSPYPGRAIIAVVVILAIAIAAGAAWALLRSRAPSVTGDEPSPSASSSPAAEPLRVAWYSEERTNETWERGYQEFSYRYELRSANLDGTDERLLLRWDLPPVGAVSVIRALPGQRIAIFRFAGDDDIKVINADGTPASLAGLPRDSKLLTVVGSPDGSRLAYTDYETGFAVVDRSGSGGWYDFPKGLGGPNGVGIGPLLDDGYAVFNWGDAGAGASWLVKYDAPGGPRIIDRLTWGFGKFSTYTDPNHVLTIAGRLAEERGEEIGPTTITVTELSTGTTASIGVFDDLLSGAYFSDDRRRIALPGEGKLLVMDAVGGSSASLSEIALPGRANDVRWMPDGRAIVLISDAVTGTAGAYVVDPGEASATRLDAFPVGTLVDQYGNSRLVGIYAADGAGRRVPSPSPDGTEGWVPFSSRYFTLSFNVPAGFSVHDSQDYIAVSEGQYRTTDIGDDNAFLSIRRFTDAYPEYTAIEDLKRGLKDISAGTVVVDGVPFRSLTGTDIGRYEGESAGRVLIVVFDKSVLYAVQWPRSRTIDGFALAERILSTLTFSR